MKRVHIAIGVADFDASVADYTGRLEAVPVVVVPGEYALWRTDILNLSIRMVAKSRSSIAIRHIGIEDDSAPGFSASVDVNVIEWEMFSPEAQMAEILALWPNAEVTEQEGQ